MKHEEPVEMVNTHDTRNPVYARNSLVESEPTVNAGYRALNSLQMANNEHIVKSLFSQPIFNLGYGPTVDTLEDVDVNDPRYNLKYNKTVEESIGNAVYTLDPERESTPTDPAPKVNNIMKKAGDAMDI